jgi:RNA polymerase sigma factor (sigma-70 family)
VETISLEDAYRRWADDLVAFASTVTARDEAADAVADVFQRLLADPSAWDAVREPRAFLFRCVANEARANGRSAGRRRSREIRDSQSNASPGGGESLEGWSAVLVDDRVRTALSALSAQQRAVVFLTYWMDEPVDRVAEILGVRSGTVRRQLARARHRLRGALS